jgi:hypothetical protein
MRRIRVSLLVVCLSPALSCREGAQVYSEQIAHPDDPAKQVEYFVRSPAGPLAYDRIPPRPSGRRPPGPPADCGAAAAPSRPAGRRGRQRLVGPGICAAGAHTHVRRDQGGDPFLYPLTAPPTAGDPCRGDRADPSCGTDRSHARSRDESACDASRRFHRGSHGGVRKAPPEICVERVLPQRRAEAEGAFDIVFGRLNPAAAA